MLRLELALEGTVCVGRGKRGDGVIQIAECVSPGPKTLPSIRQKLNVYLMNE